MDLPDGPGLFGHAWGILAAPVRAAAEFARFRQVRLRAVVVACGDHSRDFGVEAEGGGRAENGQNGGLADEYDHFQGRAGMFLVWSGEFVNSSFGLCNSAFPGFPCSELP